MSLPELNSGARNYLRERTEAAHDNGDTILWDIIADDSLEKGTYIRLTNLETNDTTLKFFPTEYEQMELGL